MSPASLLRRTRSLLPSVADYRETRRSWPKDLLAGATVGIVALPLALGFGVSSGLTAEQGLITAIVAGFFAAVFGGSHLQISGPTGAMAVVLVPIVASHGAEAVITVTLIAGLIVVAAGLLRLGRTVSFIPWPVIEGFTIGIAAIIFLQQIPFVTTPRYLAPGEVSMNAFAAAVQLISDADWSYLPYSLGAVAIVAVCMVVSPKIHSAIPGSLVGIIIVTVLSGIIPNPLATIEAIPQSLPAPSIPVIDPAVLPALLPAAGTIAALAAIESLLSARVASSMSDAGAYQPDRELVGQGVASIGSSLFGGMPATGAIARTSVNIRAGGRTRLASITHAAVLLLIVLVAAAPVSQIPLAALGGVLFVTAVRMIDLETMRSILRSTKSDAFGFVITALITVSFDLIVAVGIGVVVAAFFALRKLSATTSVRIERLSETEAAQPGDEKIAIVHFRGPLFFASADRISDEVMELNGVSVVVLRMSQLELVDATGAHILTEMVTALERRGITVLIKGVRDSQAGLFEQVGVLAALRHHRHLFDELPAALDHARSHVERAHQS
ncbi:SulP family inorganic anion transporter [Brevibacterium linens]|uniref:Sulfate permease, SulP family n=2 Tax=Brevibacterium linens TaxID=1703 RepID=A0A2H1JI76_BRELN|nr:SulP family inorganic anion transporter [Brevibacterium linens]AZU01369.1 SulP family inorganic anion transporter [Brevibacterium linens]KAB1949839.1 SulP family inorganic anion transporter [Brevibacterium linens ATCC 9172]SMX66110.1 sulfate permease, SulP family [Brevibacterium linens ATCC 9172]SMX86862.1 sulfate permease, SulP family [Brevibacterium linens]